MAEINKRHTHGDIKKSEFYCGRCMHPIGDITYKDGHIAWIPWKQISTPGRTSEERYCVNCVNEKLSTRT